MTPKVSINIKGGMKMGLLVVKGKGKKEYTAEIMKVKLTFRRKGVNLKRVLNMVINECEEFLNELDKIGIAPESIQIVEDDASNTYRDDAYEAVRKIEILTKVDKKLYSYIISLIRNSENPIGYSVDFYLDNLEEKAEELLKLAINDSRRQAEIIAESLGEKIWYAKSVNENHYSRNNESFDFSNMGDIGIPMDYESSTPFSDRLEIPTIEKSEEISIEWTMGSV